MVRRAEPEDLGLRTSHPLAKSRILRCDPPGRRANAFAKGHPRAGDTPYGALVDASAFTRFPTSGVPSPLAGSHPVVAA